jgi:hypothetical protein
MNKKTFGTIILVIILIITIYIVANKKETISPITQTATSTPTETFSTSTYKYINFFDWPPQIEISNNKYSCVETSTTTELIINSSKYCRSIISEGAAGSIYNTYTYTFAKEDQTKALTFSTRQPQCMNYDNPKQTECLSEIKNIDMDNIIDKFINVIK